MKATDTAKTTRKRLTEDQEDDKFLEGAKDAWEHVKQYERGLEDGKISTIYNVRKLTPFWVYGAIDNRAAGMEPQYRLVSLFKNRDDAEAFIENRKRNVKDYETLFLMEDYSKRGENEDYYFS